jgi:hypothetical protein
MAAAIAFDMAVILGGAVAITSISTDGRSDKAFLALIWKIKRMGRGR